MPIVQMQRGVSPVQIDFDESKIENPKEFKRSVKGALHFAPGCTKTITDDELAYLQKNAKDFVKRLHVVPQAKAAEVVEKSVEEAPKASGRSRKKVDTAGEEKTPEG